MLEVLLLSAIFKVGKSAIVESREWPSLYKDEYHLGNNFALGLITADKADRV